MFARVPESMWSIRCEMGCPMVMFMPGISEKSRRRASRSRFPALPHAEGHVQLCGLDPLGVLIELGPARAPGDGDDLWMRQEVFSTTRPRASDSARGRPRKRHRTDGQRALR